MPGRPARSRRGSLKLTVAYSPCPNDTFMFRDIAVGELTVPGWQIECRLDDIETLNRLALKATFDITKLSFHAYLLAQEAHPSPSSDQYEMLNVGAAMGYGCGPVVVAKKKLTRRDLASCTVAVPGELTTAHLLLRLWAPQATKRIFARYDQIMALIDSGEADAGVVIHEGRFTYEQAGFELVADLGRWWESQTHLPLPLACIAGRKGLGRDTIERFEALLKQAIGNSLAHPDRTHDYIRRHAQETDQAVLAEHIKTFVNDYSLDLGDEGKAAVAKLREMADRAGVLQ